MRVLFVTGLTGFGLGGARTEEIRLVRGTADKGCLAAMCSDVLAEELSGIPHFRLDYPPGPRAPEQLAKAVAEFRPDLVHVVGGGVRFLTVCNQQLENVPWVFTAHNIPPAERIFHHFYGNSQLHYGVRNALALPNIWSWRRYLKAASYQVALCHSQTVAQRLANAGCPADKVREIPFGSELSDEAMKENAAVPSPFRAGTWPKIVTVAGFAHHKGQLDGVRLAARLLADFPGLQYFLIGMTRDKAYRAYLEKTIGRLGLSPHVSIMHSATEPLKFAALRAADLYLQPSHEEGFCIAYLEAAMLVPRMIGADTGAIAAMAEGDALSRVVAPCDLPALETTARELLQREVPPDTLAHRRADLTRRYSWDAYLDAHLDTYRRILR